MEPGTAGARYSHGIAGTDEQRTGAAMRTTLGRGAVLSAAALAACGGHHHLEDYDFADRSMAVVHFATPAPELRTGGYGSEAEDAVGVVLAAGGRMARELEARRARGRLDSAATRLDLAGRMADRTLERAGRYLGTRAVEDRAEADYLLEVDVRDLALDARSDRIHLVVAAEAVLLDGRTGREIWTADVRGADPLSPDLAAGTVLEDVLGAGALTLLSVEDFELVLSRMADYTADRIARELRGDLRDVRDRSR